MPKLPQIRGALLEEAILYLLRSAGFSLVTSPTSDPTLSAGASGMEVRGRGANHQIDAIADLPFSPPFTHPQRLLVEAKFLKKPVGIEVIRNSVGVGKDVNEYWHRERPHGPAAVRYHYHHAVISASGFSAPAQEYAFAQDVFLFPLQDSHRLDQVVRSIRNLKGANFGHPTGKGIGVRLDRLRSEIRHRLPNLDDRLVTEDWDLQQYARTVRGVGAAVIGMAGGFFPLLLVPEHRDLLGTLDSDLEVRIRFDGRGWYIEREHTRLFSFQLPGRLFQLYARGGRLTAQGALDMKRAFFRRLDLVHAEQGVPRLTRLMLDMDWIDTLETRINHESHA